MYAPRLEPKGKKTKKTTVKKERIHRDSRLTINNYSGIPFKLLLLYDYALTCHYAKEFGKENDFAGPVTTRSENGRGYTPGRVGRGEQGGARP